MGLLSLDEGGYLFFNIKLIKNIKLKIKNIHAIYRTNTGLGFKKPLQENDMLVSSPNDYREAVSHRLPKFLFDYIDGGVITESTMKANFNS